MCCIIYLCTTHLVQGKDAVGIRCDVLFNFIVVGVDDCVHATKTLFLLGCCDRASLDGGNGENEDCFVEKHISISMMNEMLLSDLGDRTL
jgi:hypothetical protein